MPIAEQPPPAAPVEDTEPNEAHDVTIIAGTALRPALRASQLEWTNDADLRPYRPDAKKWHDDEDDPMAAARGLVVAIGLVVPLWAGILALAYWLIR
ncbi:hypothetical protein [Limobrevibacterium gyesilva]|uniref:Uncharacterized protein n=1 Tax=Limobrevibacterium gyesilva TaxID=2991712 RepID=A0AA42CJ94_9PROT|nr:hypothetical protein [Limobrevibacterium gyesilva]MCW3476687.1 hypothetical protein [Limobrevibacterium gyesilva]